jgi:ferredoxin--NADP+ reductase
MTYVITQACCNDASCVAVCPVNCIHPTADEAQFMTSESLYIDADTCIDCGACVEECPVDAIRADDELTPATERFLDINAAYYERYPRTAADNVIPSARRRVGDLAGVRVAIVGSGPAASYAAAELLDYKGVEIDMYDRLLTPYGLVRSGVAPDHPGTKEVTRLFDSSSRKKGFALHLGVEIGRHVTHEELIAHHSAVIYATGASADRELGIPGEQLPGSHSATEFVGWYNGHPDHSDKSYELSGERAVIIGNGNVALDVARILVSDPDELDRTDIADHALDILRGSSVQEVVVIGRRGPAQAAFTNSELLALLHLPDIDVVVDPAEAVIDPATQSAIDSDEVEPSVKVKVGLIAEIAERTAVPGRKRIVLRFGLSPVEIVGDGAVARVKLVRNTLEAGDSGSLKAVPTDEFETLDTKLVLRSVGYRGRPVPGVPFDEKKSIISNVDGRVVDETDSVVPGVYTTGWIKRGPSGVIGTNRKCARDTVAALVEDHQNGLVTPAGDRAELDALLAERAPDAIDFADWSVIDKAEKSAGKARGRTRVKFFSADDMLAVIRGEVSAS